ncbi:hypothetical protein MMC26_002117 [Xylographa opegraphella]|nr:hypothetical protein [Xylographa opegraphella]
MVDLLEKEEWDLSPIINLINSLSAPDDVHLVTDVRSRRFNDSHYAPPSELQKADNPYLGNFDDIWKFLGQPCDVEAPKINPSLKVDPYIFSGPEDIHVTGDESSNDNGNAKAVRWRDETVGADLEDNDQHDRLNSITNNSGLSKSQQKRQRRKLRKELKDEAGCTTQPSASVVQSAGISDKEDNEQHDGPSLTANNSGLTLYQLRKQRRKVLRKRSKYEALVAAQLSASGIQSDNIADTEDNGQQDGFDAVTNVPGSTQIQTKKERKRLEREAKYEALGAAPLSTSGIQSDSTVEQQSMTRRALIQQITNSTPAYGLSAPLSANLSRAFLENCRRNGITVGNSPYPLVRTQSAPSIPAVPQETSREVNLSVAATKKAILLSKLKAQFVDERPLLENLAVLQHTMNGHETSVEGIHVFVDISNILIGFHDALKLARGLSIHTRLRRQTLSFHNLSLILERGRPTAKRVLAGSDNIDATQEASQLGYETNILDRVHKAKPLTPSQRRYLQPPNPSTTNLFSGQSSGSETNPTHGPEKWVEQAVDEILHLKILESVVDAPTPSTIVLATGDAAEAEYSGGFLRMVERALAKGWRVEVVSFRHNTSGAYRRRDFCAAWGESFRTVELDPFVEELLVAQA